MRFHFPEGFFDDPEPCPDPCTDPCCIEHGCEVTLREDCACRKAQPEWKEEVPWDWTRD